MLYALTAVLADVGDNTPAVFKSQFNCKLGGHLKDVTDKAAVFGVYACGRGDMGLGNDENVRRSLRSYVVKGVSQLVGPDLL